MYRVNKDIDTDLKKLMSERRSDILDGLSHIKADRMNPPQGPLLSRALELLQFPDADIREEAVAALALHWQCKDALPILSEMLKGGESDQVVLEIAARAVSVYAGQDMYEKNTVLAAIVLNFKSELLPDQISFDKCAIQGYVYQKALYSYSITNFKLRHGSSEIRVFIMQQGLLCLHVLR